MKSLMEFRNDDGLQAGRVRHAFPEIRLHGALKRAHPEDIGLDAQLFEQVFVVVHLRAQAVELQRTLRIEVNSVGYGCQVVAFLRAHIVVGHHKLARLLEVQQLVAHLLQRGHAGLHQLHVQQNAFDVVVLLGPPDGFFYVEQATAGATATAQKLPSDSGFSRSEIGCSSFSSSTEFLATTISSSELAAAMSTPSSSKNPRKAKA